MEREKLRKEIEDILEFYNVTWHLHQIADKILEVVEREARAANNEGYHDCELDHTGTIGCSFD